MALIMWLLKRFREPSSWAGLSMMLALAGINLPDGGEEAVAQLLAGIAAVVAVFVPERRRDDA